MIHELIYKFKDLVSSSDFISC